jgi:hypothetical protein
LDVEYGFHLQEWLLKHFAILAFFESSCEPWFTGARVTTVATLLRREPDSQKRADNLVRFVQLRQPLNEILEGLNEDPLTAAGILRDVVEKQDDNLLDSRWRIRVVNQLELWRVGCMSGMARGASETPSEAVGEHPSLKANSEPFQGKYAGGKWGIYLRAPDIFFTLLDRCASHLVPLGQVAEIRFGLKSGADDFFFVRDVTEDEIQKHGNGLPGESPAIARRFREKWGVNLKDSARVRVVESGDGSRHLIEAEYLEPYAHGFMEIQSVVLRADLLERRILLVSDPPQRLKGTHVLKYIHWGEREGFNQRVTVRARAQTRLWYDLIPERRGEIIWPKLQQYRHVVAINPNKIIVNCNLYDLFCRESVKSQLLAGILNSTIVALSRHQFGSFMGREGNLVTEIFDAKMLLCPDPRNCPPLVASEIHAAFSAMQKRQSLPLADEFQKEDRRRLDEAVLRLLGYSDAAERAIVQEELYREMAGIHKEIRVAELEMQGLRRTAARRDRASPRTIAVEIWEEFDKTQIRTFPDGFISANEPFETVSLPTGKPRVLEDLFDRGAVQVNGSVIKLGSQGRAEFAAKAIELGHYGPVPIPKSERTCEKALDAYKRYESQMNARFRELGEERSVDTEIQSRIVHELWKLLLAHARP